MGEARHTVLIADDHDADRFFLKEAIRRHAPRLQVVGEVSDGEQVIEYLSGKGGYADRALYPMPEVLILDVRMPRMTGIEVLEWLKTEKFPGLKVALLADSSSMIYKEKAESLGVKHFYSKLVNTDELVRMVIHLQAELDSGQKGRCP